MEQGIELPPGGPWPAASGVADQAPYLLPFLFATNGRPYLRQIETESGIWFRDTRDPSNLRRALSDWPTPQGLLAQLDMDRAKAQSELVALPFDFGFPLRDYQEHAISRRSSFADGGHTACFSPWQPAREKRALQSPCCTDCLPRNASAACASLLIAVGSANRPQANSAPRASSTTLHLRRDIRPQRTLRYEHRPQHEGAYLHRIRLGQARFIRERTGASAAHRPIRFNRRG